MSFCRHSTPNSSPVSWIQSRRRLVSKHSRSQSVAIRAVAGNSTMANSVRVVVVQMTSVNDIAANFATCSRLVKRIQNLDLTGGFQEKGQDDSQLCITHVLIDDTGNIRSKYRKIHLFDVDVPGGAVYKESSFIEGGKCLPLYDFSEKLHSKSVKFSRKEVVMVDSSIGCLGVTVCYDLRFPRLYQLLRFQHEAQVLLVPAAFTKVTGQAHWEILLRACAIETQCYFIAAAQAGKHNDKRESYGDSLIIDPWGTISGGRLPDRLSTGIAVADIDFSLIDSVRTKMPISQAWEARHNFGEASKRVKKFVA